MKQSERAYAIACILVQMEDEVGSPERGVATREFCSGHIPDNELAGLEADGILRVAADKLMGLSDDEIDQELEAWGATVYRA